MQRSLQPALGGRKNSERSLTVRLLSPAPNHTHSSVPFQISLQCSPEECTDLHSYQNMWHILSSTYLGCGFRPWSGCMLSHNLGMCPDQAVFQLWEDAPTSWAHRPGPSHIFQAVIWLHIRPVTGTSNTTGCRAYLISIIPESLLCSQLAPLYQWHLHASHSSSANLLWCVFASLSQRGGKDTSESRCPALLP